jgi:chaperone required for assembly of F1-ATPase
VKRFWKRAEVAGRGGGWGVDLDGKPLRTPARELMVVPTKALALAIADEWNGVGERIEPRSMPLTGLANAAIDRIAPEKEAFARSLGRYAEADLACYRADGPKTLCERQDKEWDALLGWGRRRFDVDFSTTKGITHVAQPTATVERLSHAISALDSFQLAGLSPLVTIGGSLLAALGVLDGAFTAEQAWDAVSLDDRWQIEQWGSDPEAEAALAGRRWDFLAAARFLELLEG